MFTVSDSTVVFASLASGHAWGMEAGDGDMVRGEHFLVLGYFDKGKNLFLPPPPHQVLNSAAILSLVCAKYATSGRAGVVAQLNVASTPTDFDTLFDYLPPSGGCHVWVVLNWLHDIFTAKYDMSHDISYWHIQNLICPKPLCKVPPKSVLGTLWRGWRVL